MATDKRGSTHNDQSDRRRALDQVLDEALQETFPGSDPVSVVQPSPTRYDTHKEKEPEAAERAF